MWNLVITGASSGRLPSNSSPVASSETFRPQFGQHSESPLTSSVGSQEPSGPGTYRSDRGVLGLEAYVVLTPRGTGPPRRLERRLFRLINQDRVSGPVPPLAQQLGTPRTLPFGVWPLASGWRVPQASVEFEVAGP